MGMRLAAECRQCRQGCCRTPSMCSAFWFDGTRAVDFTFREDQHPPFSFLCQSSSSTHCSLEWSLPITQINYFCRILSLLKLALKFHVTLFFLLLGCTFLVSFAHCSYPNCSSSFNISQGSDLGVPSPHSTQSPWPISSLHRPLCAVDPQICVFCPNRCSNIQAWVLRSLMDTSICMPSSPLKPSKPQNNEACCPSHTLNLLFSSMPFPAGLLKPRHHPDSSTSPFPKSHQPLKSWGFYLLSTCHICPSLLCPLLRAASYEFPHGLLKQFASGSPHFHSCVIQNGSHAAHAMILEYKPDLSLCCGAQDPFILSLRFWYFHHSDHNWLFSEV